MKSLQGLSFLFDEKNLKIKNSVLIKPDFLTKPDGLYRYHCQASFVARDVLFKRKALAGKLALAQLIYNISVRYHCGGWPEEVNTCFLNSYMVYL